MVKSIDNIAKGVFLTSWTAVAVEAFMATRPERQQLRQEHGESVVAAFDGSLRIGFWSTGSPSTLIENAVWQLAEAWEVPGSIPRDGGKEEMPRVSGRWYRQFWRE